MANPLSNLAKRDIAFSGRAHVGDVPQLYAARDALARAGEAQMGGTPGLGSGEGAGAITPTATGGGGAVGGAADTGLPGQGFVNQDLERLYTRAYQASGEGADRGQIASRGSLNIDPADPFGVNFGTGLATATQVAQLLGVPYAGLANQFVNLALQDAQGRTDQFFEGLIEGTAPVDYSSGVGITRSGSTDITDFSGALATGDIPVDTSSGVSISRGGDFGAGPGSDLAADLATGNVDIDTSSGVSIGRGDGGGDAGSGGGGGPGAGGCFVAGTKVLMADGSERNIETLQLGDKVMAFDADTGEQVPCEVISRFAHRNKPIWCLNDSTHCTPNHRFFAKFGANGWGFWPLEEIPIGGRIAAGDGSETVVESLADIGRRADVFNIEVERLHTYIADGYRVHNEKHEGGYIDESRVPGETRGDVPEVLQEGEYVINADVVDMLGREFFEDINRLARMGKGRR